METIRCKALKAFTHHVPGHGQVHGDPDSSLEEARYPEVPVDVVEHLADEGRVETPAEADEPAAPPKGKGKKAAAPAEADEAPAE